MRLILINVGLILDFSGVILLLYYTHKTSGAVDQGSKDHLASRYWQYFGYISLAIGFLVQIIAMNIIALMSVEEYYGYL